MTQLIGLTGGIASGKSTVAQILRTNMHVEVVDADVLAREAVAPKSAGLRQVVELFGDDVLRDDGTLDRPKVGAIVFADDEKRRALNAIVHPEVGRLFAERFSAVAERGDPFVVYEVPLLFENNLDAMMAATILVATGEERQIERMKTRDGLDEAGARARIAAQMPLAEKRARATITVDNTGTLEDLHAAVEQAWGTIVAQVDA